MADPEDHDKLATLAERISQAEERSDPLRKTQGNKPSLRTHALAKVMRIGADFVTTILGALGLGWFIDEQFGIAPWCMIAFLLIGFVIAFWNLIKASESQ